jgi:hypothetical protein
VEAPTRFGRENPTRASSEAPGHSGRLANDGNAATFWQAAGDDRQPWWRVDLERLVTVSRTRLAFPTAGDWRYRIEISDDGGTGWRLVTDQTQNPNPGQIRDDAAPDGIHGRFLRVTFTGEPPGQPAGLAEVEVWGGITTQ